MITRYSFAGSIKTTEAAEADWLDVSEPTSQELAEIASKYNVPIWMLTEPLDAKERPRLDQEGDKFLLVARFLVDRNNDGGRFCRTIPVGVILGPEVVITICRRAEVAAESLKSFTRPQSWTPLLLAFKLFRFSAASFIAGLEGLEEDAVEAETRLRAAPENSALLALLDIQKALIDITVALKSNQALFEKLRQGQVLGPTALKNERDILDDAITENQQAVFTAEIFGQTLAGMSDAFGSIISNNLNKSMKFLAGVTIVLMLPTIIAGLYGMNVDLPGSSVPAAFWLLSGLSLALMLGVSWLFARKKWF